MGSHVSGRIHPGVCGGQIRIHADGAPVIGFHPRSGKVQTVRVGSPSRGHQDFVHLHRFHAVLTKNPLAGGGAFHTTDPDGGEHPDAFGFQVLLQMFRDLRFFKGSDAGLGLHQDHLAAQPGVGLGELQPHRVRPYHRKTPGKNPAFQGLRAGPEPRFLKALNGRDPGPGAGGDQGLLKGDFLSVHLHGVGVHEPGRAGNPLDAPGFRHVLVFLLKQGLDQVLPGFLQGRHVRDFRTAPEGSGGMVKGVEGSGPVEKKFARHASHVHAGAAKPVARDHHDGGTVFSGLNGGGEGGRA